MIDRNKIGAFLRELRREKNITQEELAEKFGVSSRSVSRWENGSTMPELGILVDLADFFQVDIRELIDGERKNGLAENGTRDTLRQVADYAQTEKKTAIKRKKKSWIWIVAAVIAAWFLSFLGFSLFISTVFNSEYTFTTDLAAYPDVIGGGKWGMSEEIFPETVTGLRVTDFRYVYNDPWDANYLAYLVVEYDSPDEYAAEMDRLRECGITEHIGYYGVTGFSEYRLAAMNADSYQGFVYALTDGESKIIYAELIFCNYYMDIDYREQMPAEYLPDGFDASVNNPYMKANTEPAGKE